MLSKDDNFELLDYMCSKLGIKLEICNDAVFGTVLGFPFYLHENLSSINESTVMNNLLLRDYIVYRPSASMPIYEPFSLKLNAIDNFLKVFIQSIDEFRFYDGPSCHIVNQFFEADSILHSKSLWEAKIQVDLTCPNDYSSKIQNYVIKSLIEKNT